MDTRDFLGYMFAFLSGLAIGVLAALLLAPVSGAEMRTQIREKADSSRQQIKTGYEQSRNWVSDQSGKLHKATQPESVEETQ